MSYTLRQYKPQDARGVKELVVSILTKEYPYDRQVYSDSDLDKVSEVYGGDGESFFVIEEGSKIVGTVGVKKDSDTDALLRRLFVDETKRGRGYGAELVTTALEFCLGQGYKRVMFRCTDRMASAIKLLKSRGFKEAEALEISGFKIHKLELHF